jgi:hypothetical protein
MGTRFFDQYSLLHFATGCIAYFWGFGFLLSLFAHALFEYVENTPAGIRFINQNLAGIWPGGKPRSDSGLNILGDNVFFAVGWAGAHALDIYGIAQGWY